MTKQNLDKLGLSKMDYRFDIQFLKRFRYLCSKLRSPLVFHLFLALLLIRLLQEYVYYRVGLITSEFYKVLGEKDKTGFLWLTIKSLILFATVSLIKSSSSYLASVFYITCRKLLTEELHHHYFQKQYFYEINVFSNDIDNPDQRITQDTDKLCLTLSNVLPMLMISPFTIAYYTYMSFTSTGWIGPVSVVVYFLVSTFINKILMSPVVSMVYLQEKCEGFFRYQHMHVRSYSEAIAFQSGQNIEHQISNRKLKDLINTQEKLFLRRYPLDTSVNLFNYFGSIISFLVLSVPIFTGLYDDLSSASLSALISKNTFVTMYLISCFSNLVSLSEDFTTLAGTSHRVAQLLSYMEDKTKATGIDNINFNYEDQSDKNQDDVVLLRVENLNFSRPDSERPILSSNLNFNVEKRLNCLVVGKSGLGKTSVFRVLKGLWKPTSGNFKFYFPTDSHLEVLYLTQKPLLMPNATLREQILYPLTENEDVYPRLDEEIVKFIEACDLSTLMTRLKLISPGNSDFGFLDIQPEWNWCDTLSPGEMQRVSFMRVFYHRPVMAFLDESLSAVSPDLQFSLYNLCSELKLTLVTIGHDESLKKYHERVINLDG